MSENEKNIEELKRSQKSTIRNPTQPHFEDGLTSTHEGTASEVEDVDPEIIEDSDAEDHQKSRC